MCRFVGPKAHNEWFAYPRAAPWTSYRWVASLQSLENHVCGTNIIKNTAKSCSINSKALHWFTGRMGKLIAFTALGITPTRTMAPLVLLVYWAKLSVFFTARIFVPQPLLLYSNHVLQTSAGMSCEDGMVYQPCHPMCDTTCIALSLDAACTETCVEGCACPGGYVLDPHGECVTREHCSCVDPDTGEFHTNLNRIEKGCGYWSVNCR